MNRERNVSLLFLLTPHLHITFHILSLLFADLLPFDTVTHLRYPDALSSVRSLRPSALKPALFLARTRSPTKAWASPASSPLSSSSSPFASSDPSMSASIPRHTSFARCSASLSPTVLNSLCSWCRLTPVKMLEHADFLLRWLESFHCTGARPSSEEADAMLRGWKASRCVRTRGQYQGGRCLTGRWRGREERDQIG